MRTFTSTWNSAICIFVLSNNQERASLWSIWPSSFSLLMVVCNWRGFLQCVQRVSKANSCHSQISIQVFLVNIALKGLSCAVSLEGLMVWCCCWGSSSNMSFPVDVPVSVTVSWLCTDLRDCDFNKSIICFSSITFFRAKSPPLWFFFFHYC